MLRSLVGSEMCIRDSIEAIEYADAVYAERMHIEPGAAPNTNLPTAAFIPAVTDLTVVNLEISGTTPSFGLQWTIPTTGLIENYDIYVNSNSEPFNDNNTVFLQSVRSAAGIPNFLNGQQFVTTISTLPSGTYNIWVVGRNDFVTSAESNTVNLVWDPAVDATRVQVIRHHDNSIRNDPRAPTGIDGTGGGWYDPVEGSPITANRPTDPNPHWEAVTQVVPEGARPRVVDFTTSGTAGGAITQDTNTTQIIEFDVSGDIGQRVQTRTAQPEITEFTFSGQAAEVDFTPGTAAEFTFSSTGTTANVALGRHESDKVDVTGSSTGPITSQVTVQYDSDISPSSQVIDLGDSADSEALAQTLASAINNHPELSAVADSYDTSDVSFPVMSGADDDRIVSFLTMDGLDPGFTLENGTRLRSKTQTAVWNNFLGTSTTIPEDSILFMSFNTRSTTGAQGGINIFFFRVTSTVDASGTGNHNIPVELIGETRTSVNINTSSIDFSPLPLNLEYEGTTSSRTLYLNRRINIVNQGVLQDTVVISPDAQGVYDLPTFTVTRTGSSLSTPTFTDVRSIVTGQAPAGRPTSYSLTRAGVEVGSGMFAGSDSSPLDATPFVSDIAGFIGADYNIRTSVGTLIIEPRVSSNVDDINLTISDVGLNGGSGTTPDIAITRMVTDASNPTATDGTFTAYSITVGGTSVTSGVIDSGASSATAASQIRGCLLYTSPSPRDS